MHTLNFSALEHNAKFFKNILGNAKLCAVVKNDAYGHGIVHIARYLNGIADCFAVGSLAEAKQISFVNKDILILLPQNGAELTEAVKSRYILTIDSFDSLTKAADAARTLRLHARAHIKIDSGMSRLGFKGADVSSLVKALKASPQITVEGVYSHFYGENTGECDKQYAEFCPCAKALEKALNKRLIKHIANSGGAILSRKYCMDMARIGLGLYGYGNEHLQPVKTVTARVVAIKDVARGDVVGYGAKYVADEDKRIVVLNVGYAQGFVRALTGAKVQINGRNCKILAVCMAMSMADITDVEVNIGDEATLFGGGVNVSNDVVSVYELLCNLK